MAATSRPVWSSSLRSFECGAASTSSNCAASSADRSKLAVGADVGLDAPYQAEPALVYRVEATDLGVLPGGVGHRHPAGDLQAMRMIGDGGVGVPARQAGVGDLAERGHAVAPL